VATCSPKTGPREMRGSSARMPAGRPRDEAEAVHRGADHRDPEGGRPGRRPPISADVMPSASRRSTAGRPSTRASR
jgi:hypothetical protein